MLNSIQPFESEELITHVRSRLPPAMQLWQSSTLPPPRRHRFNLSGYLRTGFFFSSDPVAVTHTKSTMACHAIALLSAAAAWLGPGTTAFQPRRSPRSTTTPRPRRATHRACGWGRRRAAPAMQGSFRLRGQARVRLRSASSLAASKKEPVTGNRYEVGDFARLVVGRLRLLPRSRGWAAMMLAIRGGPTFCTNRHDKTYETQIARCVGNYALG